MPEREKAERILNNFMESISDSASNKKSVSVFEEEKSNRGTSRLNRLFGRKKPVHNVFGGGKAADVLLWRDKKISASILSAASAIWALFEWLDYNLLPLACFALGIGMVAQFVLSNASSLLKRPSSKVPRLVLPEELFVNIAKAVGAEVNRDLAALQNIAIGGNLKEFLVAVGSLWSAAKIGSWLNFLTVLYVVFVAAHTLPVLYEKYEDEVDSFVYKILDELQHKYRELDVGFLSKIPKGNVNRNRKKHE